MDARLLDRLSIDLEFYNRITTDMLIDVPVPYTTGFDEIKQNIGKLQNRGLGVTISVDAYKNANKDVYVTPYVTFSYNNEKVLEIFGGRNSWYRSGYGYGYVVGQPVSYFYPILKGVNPDTGLLEWYLPSKDIGQETRDDKRVTSVFAEESLMQNTGLKYSAPINGGFGFSAGYKAFSIQADFSFSYGKYLINNNTYFSHNPGRFAGYNQSREVLDYWKKPGDVTRFPKWGQDFTYFDSSMIEDASFLRLKNITLGYSLPDEVLKEIGFFNRMRFYVTGRNLLTWTKYKGPDPEIDNNIALGNNPNTKQYVFGVELKF